MKNPIAGPVVLVWAAVVATLAVAAAKSEDSPDMVVRDFFLSVLLQDGAELRRIVLPTEEKELAWLLRGEKAPPQVHDQIREQIQQIPIKKLKAGDKVNIPVPENKTVTVTVSAAEVGPDRAVLQVEGDPIPIRLHRIKGQWLVDPRPLIAARKAADESRKGGGKK
jgi:hypothetical protein